MGYPVSVRVHAPSGAAEHHMFKARFSGVPCIDSMSELLWIEKGLTDYFTEEYGPRYERHETSRCEDHNYMHGRCDVDAYGLLYLKEAEPRFYDFAGMVKAGIRLLAKRR